MQKDTKFEMRKGILYPVLPLRDIVIFPSMVIPLFVGRKKSVLALEKVAKEKQKVLLVTQKDSSKEDPTTNDLYSIGVIGTVLQLLKLPDGTVKILIEGKKRAKILRYSENKNFWEAYVSSIKEVNFKRSKELDALIRMAIAQFSRYVKLNVKLPPEILTSINKIDEPRKLSDTIVSYLTIKISEKQKFLEIKDVKLRLEKVCSFLEGEIEVLHTEERIRKRVKSQMEKSQKEYYLSEQMKAIQKELGTSTDGGRNEIEEFESKILSKKLTKEAKEKATSEVKKLRLMNPMSSEATVIRNYLDWILSAPWHEHTKIKRNLKEAKKILDTDHYSLEKVKERILEYLAVQNRVGKVRGQVICFVGPPGVGKTSLGKSIAKATGRNFVRISLGGLRDEAEIRGHRRTYIGAMPGKIIQGMKKSKSSNPLFLLDEIDKLGLDWRGDPSSALLEVLDPEQNSTFIDHYLEVEYDLSDVFFVTTANSTSSIPHPLLDRIEVINLSGYTEDEKLAIAKFHLIQKQINLSGLKEGELSISDKAILKLIRLYTREPGVRNLERELARIARKVVKEILINRQKKTVNITVKNLDKYSGVPRYKFGCVEEKNTVGVTTALAWTGMGGELLSIESLMLPGKGKMLITGKLGDVMQESIQAATSYVRSRAVDFGIEPSLFKTKDIHIHVPEGATPKEGPSAGVAMCISVISVLTGVPVNKDVAMTGEITLRGNVLAIGGLKEKLLAASRGGIKIVLIPKENEKDLVEIQSNIKKGLNIVTVSHIDEVIKYALIKDLNPLTKNKGS